MTDYKITVYVRSADAPAGIVDLANEMRHHAEEAFADTPGTMVTGVKVKESGTPLFNARAEDSTL